MSNVHVTSNGLLSHTHILVGGQELRATKIIVQIDNDKNMRAKLTIETYADLIDIEALEENTEIVIVDRDDAPTTLPPANTAQTIKKGL